MAGRHSKPNQADQKRAFKEQQRQEKRAFKEQQREEKEKFGADIREEARVAEEQRQQRLADYKARLAAYKEYQKAEVKKERELKARAKAVKKAQKRAAKAAAKQQRKEARHQKIDAVKQGVKSRFVNRVNAIKAEAVQIKGEFKHDVDNVKAAARAVKTAAHNAKEGIKADVNGRIDAKLAVKQANVEERQQKITDKFNIARQYAHSDITKQKLNDMEQKALNKAERGVNRARKILQGTPKP